MTTYEITFNEHTEFGKNLLAFFEENKKYLKISDSTKMTEDELETRIKRAEERYKQGESIRLDRKDFKKFLGLE